LISVPSSGPLQPFANDGATLEATFELSTVPVFEIVYHHKAGGRESARSVNADYNQGLELLLARLAQLQVTILGIVVDSSVALELEPADRELALDFPIKLRADVNTYELRLNISRAQKPIARRANVKPGSDGNSQKRIRITLTGDNPSLNYDQLLHYLVSGESL
jgi:hypothetical protein